MMENPMLYPSPFENTEISDDTNTGMYPDGKEDEE